MGGYQHGAGKLAWLGLFLAVLTGKSPLEAADLRYPESVSRFELSTRQELLYSHWLRPLIQSDDSSDWKWPKEFVNTTGRWAAAFVDSQRILEATLDGCPVEGQPALAPVNRLVADCAKLLEIPQPAVVVRSDPYPRAYVVLVADRPHLVLTSSLLDLYEESPDQLRFVVGRELGRIKCDGLKLRQVSYGLMTILGRIDDQVIPAEPIFFEIWNDGRVYDELLGGFVVYPELPNAANAGASEPVQLLPIHWDWNDRSKMSHAGLASVKLQIVPIP